MLTRNDIAPDIDRRRFAEVVRTLETTGIIQPRKLGKGRPTLYSQEDAAKIRQTLDCPDTLSNNESNPSGHLSERPDTLSDTPKVDPTLELKAELAKLRDRVESAEQGREKAESTAQVQALHVSELDSRVKDLDEERRNARARISSLETTIKKGKPKGLWERIKLALGVLSGDVAGIPALPETLTTTEKRKAA